jgi:hypothetical protein
MIRNSTPSQWIAAVVALPILALLLGCDEASRLTTIPVSGKVTYHGQPVSQGTVTFQPVKLSEGLPRRPAMGTLQSDGTYQLSSFQHNDGVIPGEYQVIVISITSGPTPEQPNVPEVWAIPKKYGNPVQTDLKATVPAEAKGTLQLDFALQD